MPVYLDGFSPATRGERHAISRTKWMTLTAAATLMAAALVPLAPALALPRPAGLDDAAAFLEACGNLAGRTILVIADENREGAFADDVAARHPVPAAMVIRASALLLSTDSGRQAVSVRYPSAGALLRDLEDLHVDYIVVDESPQMARHALWPQTQELLTRQADRLELVRSVAATPLVAIYRLKFWSPGPAKPLLLEAVYPSSPTASR